MGLEAATVSVQQAVGADEIATRRAVVEVVRAALMAAPSAFEVPSDLASRILVNGAGNFECGGPMGDNGLSGKKLVVDAYGPRVPIGGGALSGKDFYKVDRAGAIAARRLALAVVRGGGAPEATVELLWRPGDREAAVAAVTGPGGEAIDPRPWVGAVDLCLRGSGGRWPGLVRGRSGALGDRRPLRGRPAVGGVKDPGASRAIQPSQAGARMASSGVRGQHALGGTVPHIS